MSAVNCTISLVFLTRARMKCEKRLMNEHLTLFMFRSSHFFFTSTKAFITIKKTQSKTINPYTHAQRCMRLSVCLWIYQSKKIKQTEEIYFRYTKFNVETVTVSAAIVNLSLNTWWAYAMYVVVLYHTYILVETRSRAGFFLSLSLVNMWKNHQFIRPLQFSLPY